MPALIGRSVARAAIVCTPSDAVAQQVTGRLGAPEQRVVVTRLRVDRAWSSAVAPTEAQRATLGLPPRYLLFVGAAQPRKGLDVLFDAHRSRPELAPLVLARPAPADAAARRAHAARYSWQACAQALSAPTAKPATGPDPREKFTVHP